MEGAETDDEPIACDICGRTILKGERTEPYPGAGRPAQARLRALHRRGPTTRAGSASPRTRHAGRRAPRREQRRSLVGACGGGATPSLFPGARSRARGRRGAGRVDDDADAAEPRARARAASRAPPPAPRRSRRKDAAPRPRRAHDAQVKVERALELFNALRAPAHDRRDRPHAGRRRGSARARDADAPSEVTIVVAWELSWYRYRVDLGDADEPRHAAREGRGARPSSRSRCASGTRLADDDGRLAAV